MNTPENIPVVHNETTDEDRASYAKYVEASTLVEETLGRKLDLSEKHRLLDFCIEKKNLNAVRCAVKWSSENGSSGAFARAGKELGIGVKKSLRSFGNFIIDKTK